MSRFAALVVLLLALTVQVLAQSAPFRAEFTPGRGEFRIDGARGRPSTIQVELNASGRGAVRLTGGNFASGYFFGRWSGAGSLITFRIEDSLLRVSENATFTFTKTGDEVKVMRFIADRGAEPQAMILASRRELSQPILYSGNHTFRGSGTGTGSRGRGDFEFNDFAMQVRTDGTVTMTAPFRAFGYAVTGGSERNIVFYLTELEGTKSAIRGTLYLNSSRALADVSVEGATRHDRPEIIRMRWRLNATGTATTTPQLFTQRGTGKFKMTPNRADLPSQPTENYNKVTVSLGADGVLTLTLEDERSRKREIRGRWMQHEPNIFGFNVTSIRSGTNQNAFGGGTIEVSGSRLIRVRFYGKGESDQFSLTFDGS